MDTLHVLYWPRKSILYCIGRYGGYIPYWPVHWYRYPPCFVLKKISVVPASYLFSKKLATSVLDQIETSLILPHEKNHDLPKTINPIVQISGNFAPV